MNRLSNGEQCFPGRGQRAVGWDEKAQLLGLKPQALITSSLSCLIFLPLGSLAAGEGRTGGSGGGGVWRSSKTGEGLAWSGNC